MLIILNFKQRLYNLWSSNVLTRSRERRNKSVQNPWTSEGLENPSWLIKASKIACWPTRQAMNPFFETSKGVCLVLKQAPCWSRVLDPLEGKQIFHPIGQSKVLKLWARQLCLPALQVKGDWTTRTSKTWRLKRVLVPNAIVMVSNNRSHSD